MVGPGGEAAPPVDLERLFRPRSIAVVGASATEGSPGTGMWRKLRDWGGAHGVRVEPVNPTRAEVDGVACHRRIGDVPGPVDLAVVLVADVLGVIDEVLDADPAFVMVFGAGFAETGPAGAAAQRRLVERLRGRRTRLLGPNTNLNAFEDLRDDLDGPAVALITQSGHQGRPVVQAQSLGVRFSHWAPTGNEADLELADFLHWFVDRPEVGAVACYVEGFADGAALIRAAEHAAERAVPVVCVKVGRSEAGRSMARSHTGHLAGSDAVVDAVLTQHGIHRVDGLDELTDVAATFTRTRAPRRRPDAPGDDLRLGVAVYAISGGTGAHMVDLCAAAGLHIPELGPATVARLHELIPGYLRVSNPVDSGGPPSMDERGPEILAAILADDAVDLLICPITGAVPSISRPLATDLVAAAETTDKPVLVVWGSPDVDDPVYRDVLVPARIPTFRTFRSCVVAARAYVDHWTFQARRLATGRRRPLAAEPDGGAATATRRLLDRHGPGPLDERSSKAVAAAYGIATTDDVVAPTADAAVAAFEHLGGRPVVVKLLSGSFPHKSDHGLVLTDRRTAAEVRDAFATIVARAREADPDAPFEGVLVTEHLDGGVEAVVGLTHDERFGPVVAVGLGGVLVEVTRDVGFLVPPFDRDDVRRVLADRATAALLTGHRGRPPLDVDALVAVAMALQQLALDLGDRVAEVDLNPILVRERGAVALDALVVAGPEPRPAAGR